MYVAAHTVVGFIQKNLRTHLGEHVFDVAGATYEPLVAGGATLFILWLGLAWMYRKGWLIRI
jgi:predicted acyltransferase